MTNFYFTSTGFGMIVNLVRLYLPQKQLIFYYVCTHTSSFGDKDLQPRTGNELEVVFCIVLHIILGGRIKLFKLKLSQQQQQLHQEQNRQQEQMQHLQQPLLLL